MTSLIEIVRGIRDPQAMGSMRLDREGQSVAKEGRLALQDGGLGNNLRSCHEFESFVLIEAQWLMATTGR